MATQTSSSQSGDRNKMASNVSTVVVALLLAALIRVVLFEPFEIDGPSMEPTLLNGDRIVLAKYPFGLFLPFMSDAVFSWGMPHSGDVVILKSPADGVDIVKRVVGVPGDRIEIRDDVVYRNGEPLRRQVLGNCRAEEASETELEPSDCEWVEEGIGEHLWRTSHSMLSRPESMPDVMVPEGHVFVMGDHRDRSNDSRNPMVGMVPVGRIRGRATAVYWSREPGIWPPRWNRVFSSIR